MTKLQSGVFVLAAALIVTLVGSLLLEAGPARKAGGTRHQMLREVRLGLAEDRAPVADGWGATRAVLTARLTVAQRVAQRAKAARHRRHRPATTRLCRRFQHVPTWGADGTSLVVRNDNYGGQRECLANVDRWANFAVTASAARHAGREPVAFPNIFYGCSWGICSPGTRLPRRLSRLRNPMTSWYTAGRPGGRWDVAYDIWFARRRRTNGQDDGAEIMLWLR